MSVIVSAMAALALSQTQPTAAEPPVAAAAQPSAATSAPSASAAPKARAKARPAAAPRTFAGPNTTDQMFAAGPLDKAGATIMRGDSMASMSMNRLADQRALAKKAATLINAGHCPEALQLVVGKGDGLLAGNVAKACGLPEPTIR